MPRIPTLNTKQTISTDTPRMSATPPSTATTAALGRVGGMVESIGFAIAEKRQKQQDATAELDFDLTTEKTVTSFIDENKNKVDENGKLDGIDFQEAIKNKTMEAIEEVKRNNQNISGNQQFRLDQKTQIKLESVSARGKQLQDKIVADKADQKASKWATEIIDYALTGDLKTTQQSLKAFDNFIANGPESVSAKYRDANISERAYTSAIEGAINKNALGSAREMLASLSPRLSERSKIQLENKIKTAQNINDRENVSIIRDDLGTLKSAMTYGAINSDEAKVQLAAIQKRAQSVSDPSLVKDYAQKASMMTSAIEVGDDLNTLPFSEWSKRVDDAVSSMPSNTTEEKVRSAEMQNMLKDMVSKRYSAVQKNAADYFVSTDSKAKELAKFAGTPDGFKTFSGYVKSKAETFGISERDAKIVPSFMAQQHKQLLESTDYRVALQSISDLKGILGNDFSRGVLEITNDPNIIAVANVADPVRAMNLLQVSKDKEFATTLKNFKDRKQTDKDWKTDYDTNFADTFSDEGGLFAEALSQMPDNGQTINAFQGAMKKEFDRVLIESDGDFKAAQEAARSLFLGDKGKFEVAEETTGNRSVILIPRDNKYGVTADTALNAIERVKKDPTKFAAYLGLGPDVQDKFVTEDSYRYATFRINPTGDGLNMYLNNIQVRSNGKPVTLSFADIDSINSTFTEGVDNSVINLAFSPQRDTRDMAAARLYGFNWREKVGK